jgi:hypothetical protein
VHLRILENKVLRGFYEGFCGSLSYLEPEVFEGERAGKREVEPAYSLEISWRLKAHIP